MSLFINSMPLERICKLKHNMKVRNVLSCTNLWWIFWQNIFGVEWPKNVSSNIRRRKRFGAGIGLSTKLLPVSKYKRPPYWNSTSGFDLDHFPIIGVSFCIRLPNFVQIGTSTTELWRHIDFQDGGRQPCCIYFGVMADYPRSAFRGLNSDLKSLVRRINSSGDIAM